MNVRCLTTTVEVYAPGQGTYSRSLSDTLTEGRVYEVTDESDSRYYQIKSDHDSKDQSQYPRYMFKETDEPVTPLPNREAEEKAREERYKRLREDQELRNHDEAIRDSMDQFYDPKAYYARQNRKARVANALSQVFVGGIPYN